MRSERSVGYDARAWTTNRTPSKRARPPAVDTQRYPSGVWVTPVMEFWGSPSSDVHTRTANGLACATRLRRTSPMRRMTLRIGPTPLRARFANHLLHRGDALEDLEPSVHPQREHSLIDGRVLDLHRADVL